MNDVRTVMALVLLIALSATMVSASRETEQVTLPEISGPFEVTWARTDLPVAERQVDRTWNWGPEPISGDLVEPYVDAGVGKRRVRYFDKARMEVTDPGGDPNSIWYVTNGLLVVEMASGRLQIGDDTFITTTAAQVNVAGDAADPDGPTYETVQALRSQPPHADGATITSRVDRSGAITEDSSLAQFGAVAAYLVPETGHRVASPFWDFIRSEGLIWEDGQFRSAPLFPDPFFATGFPITEGYWAYVDVGGEEKEVLFQCFERRCLTYTPDNPEGWQVEAGNVGLHYFEWRYNQIGFGTPTEYPDALDNLPVVTFTDASGGAHQMRVEVAVNDPTLQCGLMHRRAMPADQGMLFVFDSSRQGGFWNCNTFVPLTLAWIDADGHIVDLTDMEAVEPGGPQDTSTYRPAAPYRYVIETNQGWFAERGIQVGDQVDLGAALTAGETADVTLCDWLGTTCGE